MQLCKVKDQEGAVHVGVIHEGAVKLLPLSLSEILHASDPQGWVKQHLGNPLTSLPSEKVKFLAPLDQQEVWAAGVTYKRSREARERESVGAARFYDLVYTAARPELFFKATAGRVVGPGAAVRVRSDSQWSVPEPELALVLSPQMRLVGYTIGNDMSARDIEGENPLYLPQAKVYDASCALGPVITLAQALPPVDRVTIRLTIERDKKPIFDGSTTLAAMARTFEDLIAWLGKENRFPDGVILLTGTGVVPPDHFSLAHGDLVTIEIAGIGRLVNSVVKD
jgi:2-dehydro-3-deoxy-D-arabinonate dehydratase